MSSVIFQPYRKRMLPPFFRDRRRAKISSARERDNLAVHSLHESQWSSETTETVGRLCQLRMLSEFTEWSRRAPSDIDGQAEGRASGSERVKRPTDGASPRLRVAQLHKA